WKIDVDRNGGYTIRGENGGGGPGGWGTGAKYKTWGAGHEAAPKTPQHAGRPTSQMPTISGTDLKVGGSGMKGFYDKMLPAFVNKYAKKWGAKVEDGQVEAGVDRYNYEGPDPRAEKKWKDFRDAAEWNAGTWRQFKAIERAI